MWFCFALDYYLLASWFFGKRCCIKISLDIDVTQNPWFARTRACCGEAGGVFIFDFTEKLQPNLTLLRRVPFQDYTRENNLPVWHRVGTYSMAFPVARFNEGTSFQQKMSFCVQRGRVRKKPSRPRRVIDDQTFIKKWVARTKGSLQYIRGYSQGTNTHNQFLIPKLIASDFPSTSFSNFERGKWSKTRRKAISFRSQIRKTGS